MTPAKTQRPAVHTIGPWYHTIGSITHTPSDTPPCTLQRQTAGTLDANNCRGDGVGGWAAGATRPCLTGHEGHRQRRQRPISGPIPLAHAFAGAYSDCLPAVAWLDVTPRYYRAVGSLTHPPQHHQPILTPRFPQSNKTTKHAEPGGGPGTTGRVALAVQRHLALPGHTQTPRAWRQPPPARIPPRPRRQRWREASRAEHLGRLAGR